MSTGGKGSKPRPLSVPKKQFDSNWDKIFGKKQLRGSSAEEHWTHNPGVGGATPSPATKS